MRAFTSLGRSTSTRTNSLSGEGVARQKSYLGVLSAFVEMRVGTHGQHIAVDEHI
jgi:hypothetical protein